MSLVQSELERRGIVNVSLTVMPDITRRLSPPRALSAEAPLGAPMGPPHDAERHAAVLRRMLELVARTDLPLLDAL